MDFSLNLNELGSNQTFIIITLCFAVLRVYLELISFKLDKLPISKMMSVKFGNGHLKKVHRLGLVLSIGYILFFAPPFLFT